MNVQTQMYNRNGVSMRDMLVAKAIQNGYNPFCRSTDAGARHITKEMREAAKRVNVPECKAVAERKKVTVREIAAPAKKEVAPRKEIITLENFELVAKKSVAVSFGMIVSVLVTAMVLAMVVYSGSLINEEAKKFNELNSTISVLEEEGKTLKVALEEKNTPEVIEQLADEYGMVASANLEREYISLSDGDKVEVYNVDKEDTSITVNLLNTFGEKISGFLEYID